MINTIFGIPVLKIQMPYHEEIKDAFLPLLEDENNFAQSDHWDCMCGTTQNDPEKNKLFPWDNFYENVQPLLGQYLSMVGFKNEIFPTLFGYAWANRYVKNEHQEIHCHGGHGNIVSCAYMLELPDEENTGEIMFYNSSNSYFPSELMAPMHYNNFDGRRHNPQLKEGEIIFFPSGLDHYVTYNKTDLRRATISANFGVNTSS